MINSWVRNINKQHDEEVFSLTESNENIQNWRFIDGHQAHHFDEGLLSYI